MSERQYQGISRRGLDESFSVEETRKSNLILEAKLLLDCQKPDEAAEKLAKAAEIERRLAEICESKGLLDKAWIHHMSAVGCWEKAGNLYAAIALSEELIARPELPDRLRQSVRNFLQTLRSRRARLVTESVGISAEG